MKHFQDSIFDNRGRPATDVTVAIYLKGTQTKASLYSDDGITSRENPLPVDPYGRFDFYVADGRYDLVVSRNSATILTLGDIEIFDALEQASADVAVSFKAATIGTLTVTGTVTAAAFAGPLTGNVTGATVGSHTGPVVGNVTGNLTGSVTGTASGNIPTIVEKRGTGMGTYSHTGDTSYADVDGTNLSYTVTIPTGYILVVTASGTSWTDTDADDYNVSLFDGTTELTTTNLISAVALKPDVFHVPALIAGDGAAHTIKLRYQMSNAAKTVAIGNTDKNVPVMMCQLMRSN